MLKVIVWPRGGAFAVAITASLDFLPISDLLEMTGTAVWAVSADGKLLHSWVDRSAWECYQRLTSRCGTEWKWPT